MASTLFGTTGGRWEDAANWSNGVPLSTTSAIVSSTGGVPVLPEKTSAVTKNLSGGGTVGICGAGVNLLKVVAPTASYAMNFCAVDVIEANTSTSYVPKGHN